MVALSRHHLKLLLAMVTCCLIFSLVYYESFFVWFPILLTLKSDVCELYRGGYSVDPGLTWWQRSCILEKEWEHIEYKCKEMVMEGNWPVCYDEPYNPLKDKPCIVYSFGIDNDFRFDDRMAKRNCTVYSFDPSMNTEDHLRGQRVHFYNLGIGAEDRTDFHPRSDGYAKSSDKWQVKTLGSIMKMLGHTPSSISVLKMDIEYHEWAVLSNLLKENILPDIKQLLVEWHLFVDSPDHSLYKQLHEDFDKFKALQFEKFYFRNEGRSHMYRQMKTQGEIAYVNKGYAQRQQHQQQQKQ